MVLELLGHETIVYVTQPLVLPAVQRMLRSRLHKLMTIMRQSWDLRLCLWVRQEWGLTWILWQGQHFVIRRLSLRTVISSGMSVLYYAAVCIEVLLPGGLSYCDERLAPFFIDVLKSGRNVSWASLTCTATVLPSCRCSRKNSKVIRTVCSVSASRSHGVFNIRYPSILHGIPLSITSFPVLGFSAALSKRAIFTAWEEPMENPRTASR